MKIVSNDKEEFYLEKRIAKSSHHFLKKMSESKGIERPEITMPNMTGKVLEIII